MTSNPQPDQPPAAQPQEEQCPPPEPLPVIPDPALINILERGRQPRKAK